MAAVSLHTLQTRTRGSITTPKTERSFELQNGENLKKTWEELTSLMVLETEGAIMFPQVRDHPSRNNI